MSFSSLRSRIEDVERDVGALSMKLQAGDSEPDFDWLGLLSDNIDDVGHLVDDTEAYFESLSSKAQESVTGGRAQEMLGHLEEAGQALLEAKEAPNLDDATCSLDRACDCLTDAMKV